MAEAKLRLLPIRVACARRISATLLMVVVVLEGCGPSRNTDPRPGGASDPLGKEPVYLLRDNGVRCVQHPCFSIDVIPLTGAGGRDTISDVDLDALPLSSAERDSLLGLIAGGAGLVVEGRVAAEASENSGRVFRVARVLGRSPSGQHP